ncbi:restriction endonuclease subunit S [Bifidobacterium longum]|uniref:restriction endonuclease subunit S n=2 Tax=Bifidobacterium longum TaxID=216816 RepID=UPI00398C9676
MVCEWHSAPLGELISYIGKGVAPKYINDGLDATMVLGQKCVRNQSLQYEQARFHNSAEKAVNPDKEVRKGDILINATGVGSAGRVAQVMADPSRQCITDGHVITLRAKDINPFYLGYFVKSKQKTIELMAEGSTGQTEMNRQRLQSEIIVTFPESKDLQKRIAEYGLAIDKKITVNNQLNDYLANLCETIASRYCNDRNSRLRDICYQVADHVDYDNANQETYVSTESLMQNKGGRQLASSLPTTGKITRYKAGDTLISNIRPYFKKIWYAPFEGTCSGDVIVFRANDPSNAPYLHACLRQDSFFDYVMQGAKGTKMPRGDKKQMMEFKVASSCSAEDLILLDSVIKQRSDNDSEITKLQKLRDTLLPKLMSGEIDVSKIDLTQLTNNHLADC